MRFNLLSFFCQKPLHTHLVVYLANSTKGPVFGNCCLTLIRDIDSPDSLTKIKEALIESSRNSKTNPFEISDITILNIIHLPIRGTRR